MLAIIVLALSTLLQCSAAVIALVLIRSAGRRLAWGMLAAALALMTVRRAISLADVLDAYIDTGSLAVSSRLNLPAELTALVIAATMLAGVLLIGRIFTEREQIETQLRESAAEQRAISDNSIDTFYRADGEGRIVLASRSVEDLLGHTVEETIGTRLASFYAEPNGREAFLAALEASDGRIRGYESDLRHKDGHIVTVETSASYLRDDAGNVVGVEGIARDITTRKRAEALNARLGRIVEDSVNEVYVFDSTTLNFLMANRGARENLGRSMDDLRSMTPVDIKPEFDRGKFERLVAPLRDGTNQIVEFSTMHERADGSRYDVEVRLQLSHTEEPPVFFAIIQDVTERRRTEDALRQAQKMEAVGQLTGGIAHDFNNLLAIIVGSLDIAQERISDDQELSAHLQRALGAAVRGGNLTKRLLAFSRRQSLKPEVIDLSTVTSGLSELLHRALGETIILSIVNQQDLGSCEVDQGLLENCVLNLAINARDAMPEGGRLTISTANVELDPPAAAEGGISPGSYVRLRAADTGVGMTPEAISRAFEPFFTTKEADKGTGLGLSMVYGFVKQSGGHVAIQSKLGKGTMVDILLPRLAQAPKPKKKSLAADVKRGSGQSILVVEDDPDVRLLVATFLTRLGYRARTAQSAPEALAALDEDASIHALITDVVLPGDLSGLDIARQCRQRKPDLPVLLMSGYAHDKAALHGRLGKSCELLQKPFSQRELAEMLNRLDMEPTTNSLALHRSVS